eukprot:Gb_29129 [translate_table: standard]
MEDSPSKPPTLDRQRRFKMPAQIINPHLGNLSPMSLVQSLVLSAQEISSMEKPKLVWQTQNIACVTRRIKLLSVLFDEINDTCASHSKAPLPPSVMLCFRELLITIQKTKVLIHACTRRSSIWSLMENKVLSRQFHDLNRDMAKALDILPQGLLDVSDDVREHVELVHRQAKKSTSCRPFVDPEDSILRNELAELTKNFELKKAPDPVRLRLIFKRLKLSSPAECRAEIRKLQEEIPKQAGTGGVAAISSINNLISLLVYAKCVLFGVEEEYELAPCSPTFHEASINGSSVKKKCGDYTCIPDELKCPISLDLMRDPVIVATGHTYDRASISQWLDSGHSTCPSSGQKLVHTGLIPNYALRSLISQWCEDNNVPFDNPGVDHTSTTQAALEAIKMAAAFLVGKLATGSSDIQRQAAYELRVLAKCGMDNRRCMAEAGAIPFLVHLLCSRDSRTQENAVTALLNLSIYDNNKTLIMSSGALDPIIEVLERGASMEARENAAAALFSLSVMDEYKITIGSRPAAIPALVSLLREGTSRGKKDAATALFNLSVYNNNKPIVVTAGAIPLLVDLLTDGTAGITDDALAVLAILASSKEGLEAISNTSALPVLIDLLRVGSAKGKENSIAVLVAMCRSGGEDMVKRLVNLPQSIPALQMLVTVGSPRAKRKATSLLKLLNGNSHRQRLPNSADL